MPITVVHSEAAPLLPAACSHAIVANGFLFTSGFGPHDPATGQVVGDTIEEQTVQVLHNLRAVLASQDLGFEHVVKTTAHLAHLGHDFAGYDRTYAAIMASPYPVRTTVGSELLGFLVEIDVVAALPEA